VTRIFLIRYCNFTEIGRSVVTLLYALSLICALSLSLSLSLVSAAVFYVRISQPINARRGLRSPAGVTYCRIFFLLMEIPRRARGKSSRPGYLPSLILSRYRLPRANFPAKRANDQPRDVSTRDTSLRRIATIKWTHRKISRVMRRDGNGRLRGSSLIYDALLIDESIQFSV